VKTGNIPINKDYELEFRYFEKDDAYKYFNRKFEIYVLKKTLSRKEYVLHMDNCDTGAAKWAPHIHKAPQIDKKLYFPVSTLNWNDMKANFSDCIVAELGDQCRKDEVRKAIAQLASPKV
jgi:hypothetical protein